MKLSCGDQPPAMAELERTVNADHMPFCSLLGWKRRFVTVASLCLCLLFWANVLNAIQQQREWKRTGAEVRTGISLEKDVIEAKVEAISVSAVVFGGWSIYGLLNWRRSGARRT